MKRFLLLLVLLFSLPLGAQPGTEHLQRGERALQEQDFRAAKTHFDRALKTGGRDKRLDGYALYGRGAARLQLEEWQAAKDDLDRSIKLDPTNPDAFAMRGMARKSLGDPNGLLLDAREAARLNPRDYADFLADAEGTVLYARILLGFFGAGALVCCIGAVPLVRALIRVTRAGG